MNSTAGMRGLHRSMSRCLRAALAVLALLGFGAAHALDSETLRPLAEDDTTAKLAVIDALLDAGDSAAIPVLQALLDGNLQLDADRRLYIVDTSGVKEAVSLAPSSVDAATLERISINNRIRLKLSTALAALRLTSADVDVRRQAVTVLSEDASLEMLPIIDRALARETDADILSALQATRATLTLAAQDSGQRLAAIRVLAEHPSTNTKRLLSARLERDADGQFVEPEAALRQELQRALAQVDARLSLYEYIGRIFSGLSLGSILLLAALGLAITFGLMGIINMAHGELLMIGAYSTYVVQNIFQSYLPGWFDWYLAAALPIAFVVTALVGMGLERGVIRFLYGRPLETLLATWGISLVLMQTVRMIFGAQNVEVTNPVWMSGGITLGSGLVLPYNRIVIIAFAAAVVFIVWVLLNRTRLGLYVRAVTQDRRMADCLGVATPRVDMLAFGLGAGIAGLGGCALSQIGNVGPDLGQSYIVDSFMVVVLGGVGQLAGTIIAAIGLGEVNKFLEPYAGAVLAKIAVLVFIIFFIQKRPQGLFAMRGRTAEN